jgi:hypothetical protein
MKKTLLTLLAAAALSTSLTGCFSLITSYATSTSTNTGELWYTKNNYFLGFLTGSSVWYCAPPQQPGPATCREAQINE